MDKLKVLMKYAGISVFEYFPDSDRMVLYNEQLEEEKDSRLAQLRADTDATFSSLDAHYEQQHSQLSRELFEKILAM